MAASRGFNKSIVELRRLDESSCIVGWRSIWITGSQSEKEKEMKRKQVFPYSLPDEKLPAELFCSLAACVWLLDWPVGRLAAGAA